MALRMSGSASSAILAKFIQAALVCAVAWARPNASRSDAGIVGLLADDLARVGDGVDHAVLADDVGRGRRGIGKEGELIGGDDLVGGVGLRLCRRQVGVQLRGQRVVELRFDRRASRIEIGVDGRAGADLGRAAGGDRGKPRRVGVGHVGPQARAAREHCGIERAVREVVHGAIGDVVDQIRAEIRIGKRRFARALDQAVAEQQAVLLVAQVRRQLPRAGENLERGLEEVGQRVADDTGQMPEDGRAEGHVADHLHRLRAELVDDAHRHLGHEQDRVDQQHAAQPLPADQALGGERIGDRRGHEPAHHDDRHGPDVRIRRGDRRDGVEDAEKGIVVAVGVDLVHGRRPR